MERWEELKEQFNTARKEGRMKDAIRLSAEYRNEYIKANGPMKSGGKWRTTKREAEAKGEQIERVKAAGFKRQFNLIDSK